MMNSIKCIFLAVVLLSLSVIAQGSRHHSRTPRAVVVRPTKPSPKSPSKNPQEKALFTSSVGQQVDPFSGITVRSLQLAQKTVVDALHLAAVASNVSDSLGLTVLAAEIIVRFTTWYPDTAALLDFPANQLFTQPSTPRLASSIGGSVADQLVALTSQNPESYATAIDNAANIHYRQNQEPGGQKVINLGWFLKFGAPELLSIRKFYPLSHWTSDMEASVREVVRLINVDNWHYADLYGRSCLGRGQAVDGAGITH